MTGQRIILYTSIDIKAQLRGGTSKYLLMAMPVVVVVDVVVITHLCR